ncbi:hypothetical protein [Nocardioides aurantiacus]|uniref:Peptidase inhibitor I78 family protein n=1 Tax=Nocardioides aurantiacus TaxID=86796 RepID=A0A3N2CVR7_9ACTN|nr:hypothetical protein [Nocardioides aurantiacus]ROR91563.1 hypothetical protein EDD33_2433 [Nocardioides aurantiacus]
MTPPPADPSEQADPSGEPDRSAEDAAADLVGRPVEEAGPLGERHGWRVRAHRPDDLLTMDHVDGRLNLEHDDDGVVRRTWFG